MIFGNQNRWILRINNIYDKRMFAEKPFYPIRVDTNKAISGIQLYGIWAFYRRKRNGKPNISKHFKPLFLTRRRTRDVWNNICGTGGSALQEPRNIKWKRKKDRWSQAEYCLNTFAHRKTTSRSRKLTAHITNPERDISVANPIDTESITIKWIKNERLSQGRCCGKNSIFLLRRVT